MQVLFPEHTTERKKPINLRQEDLLLFEHEFVKKIREKQRTEELDFEGFRE
jgi:hypothetical protein